MLSGLTLADLAIVLVSILLSMGFHEAVHAFVAHWLGDTTARDMGRLTLNPLKHIDVYTTVLLPLVLILLGGPVFFAAKPVPFNPARVKYDEFGAALIAVAGPLSNLLLALLAASAIRLFGLAIGTDTYHLVSLFLQVNIGFFVFNMIPFPPLDGSRLLYAFAPESLQRAMQQIEGMGFSAIIFFMVILSFTGLGNIIGNISESLYRILIG